jgi:hypothetical protein
MEEVVVPVGGVVGIARDVPGFPPGVASEIFQAAISFFYCASDGHLVSLLVDPG